MTSILRTIDEDVLNARKEAARDARREARLTFKPFEALLQGVKVSKGEIVKRR